MRTSFSSWIDMQYYNVLIQVVSIRQEHYLILLHVLKLFLK